MSQVDQAKAESTWSQYYYNDAECTSYDETGVNEVPRNVCVDGAEGGSFRMVYCEPGVQIGFNTWMSNVGCPSGPELPVQVSVPIGVCKPSGDRWYKVSCFLHDYSWTEKVYSDPNCVDFNFTSVDNQPDGSCINALAGSVRMIDCIPGPGGLITYNTWNSNPGCPPDPASLAPNPTQQTGVCTPFPGLGYIHLSCGPTSPNPTVLKAR